MRHPAEQPSTCAIYARISRARTGQQAGVDRQQKECRELAAQLGLEVGRVFVDDDRSAYDLKRPREAYQQLLAEMRGGRVPVLIVWHPDRLYRRLEDLIELCDVIEKSGTRIVTVTAGTIDLTTASGQMVAQNIGVGAQYESRH